MKKQLLGKVFTVVIILAVSACFVNLQGQAKVIFENGDDREDRTEGIAGRDALHLNYTIDGAGAIALDAVTPSDDADVIAFVDTWDDPNAGTTDIASLFGKTFSLVLTTNGKRLDCREKGGLGIQGQNSGRIDGGGSEELYITLEGRVGLKIDSLMYEPTERGGGDNAHFVIRDHDTDSLFFTPAGHFIYTDTDTTFVRDSVIAFDPGLLELRFATEQLTVKESDTLAGGGRLLGLFFTLMEPTNPSVAEISPQPDGARLDVATDFVILFNMAMNTAVTEAAVTFNPPLTNRVNTWNTVGDELTITSDDLAFFTDYELSISTAAQAAGGANALTNLVFTYQTLPDSPTILSTYPANEAKNVPAGTPMILEFSQSMNTNSVQNALSFEPALSDLSFSWNGSGTKVVVSSATMEASTEYTGTLTTDATDIYGVSFAEPVVFSFTTAAPVNVDNTTLQDILIYPNPVSEVLYIRGMSVSTVSIHSITGQLMKSLYNSDEIDLSDMKAGSYFVTVSDKEENSVRKLIVIQ
ncbi:MAG: Ig-like domain-containing protein [Bacteroidales bacterium]